jgi:hypothetical protein
MNCCRCPHSLASESSRRSRNPTVLLVGATSQMTMQHKYTDAGPRESATAETQRAQEHATTREANSPGSGLDIFPRQETDRRRPEAVVVRGNLMRLLLAPKARFKPTLYPFRPSLKPTEITASHLREGGFTACIFSAPRAYPARTESMGAGSQSVFGASRIFGIR